MADLTKVGVNNLLRSATLTASCDAANVANLHATMLTEFWTVDAGTQTIIVDNGVAKPIDYIGIAGHNLAAAGATVNLYWSDDNLGGSYTLITSITPVDENVIVATFAETSHRYQKIEIVGAASKISALGIGKSVLMSGTIKTPFTEPKHSAKSKYSTPYTKGGLPAGRSVDFERFEFTMNFGIVDVAWIDANWDALYAEVKIYPFFMLWDYIGHATDGVYAWTTDDINPSYDTVLRKGFTVKLGAII